MYYELNVSQKGNHYFATAPRSLTDESKAVAAYRDFVVRFPASEGFEVHLSRCLNMTEKVVP
jgi:hypothetical protein